MYASTPETPHSARSSSGNNAGCLPSFLTEPPVDGRSPTFDWQSPQNPRIERTPRQTLPKEGTPMSGPPRQSLFAETFSSTLQDSWCQSPPSVLQESSSFNITGKADTFFSPGETSSSSHSDETWVTVFGFQPGASSCMLQQFSQYGTIVKYKVSSEGNWMYLCYQSRLQAKKALSKNGKVFGARTMVGVKPGGPPDEPIHISSKENTSREARPLVQAYRASASGRQVTLPETPTPHRDTSVVSRALEYLIGW
ncbi:nucleoporin 35 [Amblyomma americanum]